jgi:enoyl-CoA hydratase/carnithine racemase
MIRYDRQDNKVNALNFDVGTEMNTLLDRLESSSTVRASVLLSGASFSHSMHNKQK